VLIVAAWACGISAARKGKGGKKGEVKMGAVTFPNIPHRKKKNGGGRG